MRGCKWTPGKRVPCQPGVWTPESREKCAYRQRTRRCHQRSASKKRTDAKKRPKAPAKKRSQEAPATEHREARRPDTSLTVNFGETAYDFPVTLDVARGAMRVKLPRSYPRQALAQKGGTVVEVKFQLLSAKQSSKGTWADVVAALRRRWRGAPADDDAVLLIDELHFIPKWRRLPMTAAEEKALAGLASRALCHLLRSLVRGRHVTPRTVVVLDSEGSLRTPEQYAAAIAAARALSDKQLLARIRAAFGRLRKELPPMERGAARDVPLPSPADRGAYHDALAGMLEFVEGNIDLAKFYARYFGFRPVLFRVWPHFHFQTGIYMATGVAGILNKCESKFANRY